MAILKSLKVHCKLSKLSMVTFREVKAYSITGSILMLIGMVGNGDTVLAVLALLFGLILLAFASKYLSELTGDEEIYGAMRIGVGFAITATIIGPVVLFSNLRSIIDLGATPALPDFANVISTAVGGLFVVWVLLVLAAIFTRRSLYALSSTFKTRLFHLSGQLLLYGALLILLLGVGFLLIFSAFTIMLVGFLSLPEEVPKRQPVDAWGKPLPPPAPASSQPGSNTVTSP